MKNSPCEKLLGISFNYKLNRRHSKTNTAQKMKFSVKDLFSKRDQIHSNLRIWSHLLKKSLMENFIFCAVKIEDKRQQEK